MLFLSMLYLAVRHLISSNIETKIVMSLFVGCFVALLLSVISTYLSAFAVIYHRSIYLGVILILILLPTSRMNLRKPNFYFATLLVLSVSLNLTNKIHHLIQSTNSGARFSYDAIIDPISNEKLSFAFLDKAKSYIEPGANVYLNEKLAGHSIISFWLSSRPIILLPGLISVMSAESYEIAREKERLILNKNRIGKLSDVSVDYAIFRNTRDCRSLGFSLVVFRDKNWQLCSVKGY